MYTIRQLANISDFWLSLLVMCRPSNDIHYGSILLSFDRPGDIITLIIILLDSESQLSQIY